MVADRSLFGGVSGIVLVDEEACTPNLCQEHLERAPAEEASPTAWEA